MPNFKNPHELLPPIKIKIHLHILVFLLKNLKSWVV